MLVPASLLQSVECSTECKNSIFHYTIGCNKYKSSLASGASPQTPSGGLFLPPGPPPPAWVHAAHRHGMVSPRKVVFQRPCSSLVLVPEEVVEPASGRYRWQNRQGAAEVALKWRCQLQQTSDSCHQQHFMICHRKTATGLLRLSLHLINLSHLHNAARCIHMEQNTGCLRQA